MAKTKRGRKKSKASASTQGATVKSVRPRVKPRKISKTQKQSQAPKQPKMLPNITHNRVHPNLRNRRESDTHANHQKARSSPDKTDQSTSQHRRDADARRPTIASSNAQRSRPRSRVRKANRQHKSDGDARSKRQREIAALAKTNQIAALVKTNQTPYEIPPGCVCMGGGYGRVGWIYFCLPGKG